MYGEAVVLKFLNLRRQPFYIKKRLFVNSWGKNNFQFQEVFFEQPAQEIACLAVLLFWHLSGVLLAICMIRFLK